jgi:hypothetical protein
MINEMYGRFKYKNKAPTAANMIRIVPMIVIRFLPAASWFLLASDKMEKTPAIIFRPIQIQQIIFIFVVYPER